MLCLLQILNLMVIATEAGIRECPITILNKNLSYEHFLHRKLRYIAMIRTHAGLRSVHTFHH